MALDPAADVLGRNPRLGGLAGEVHLEQRGHGQPAGRRVRVERVHELADLVHDLRLVRLQVADEVPAKRIAVDRMLCQEILRAVLADDLDARLGEDPELCDGDVLRRRDDGHPVARPSRIRR